MWYAFAVIAALALLALIAVQVHRVVVGYRKATGTPRQRFLAAFSDSLTILWARLLTFAGLGTTYLTVLLPQLDPSTTLGSTIAGLFTPETAKYWTAAVVIIGVITELARRAPGSVDPILPPPQSK